MRKFIVLLLLSLLSIATSSMAQPEATEMLRFVHVIPNAPNIDVYVNDQLAATDLQYAEATTYMSAPVGTNAITVTRTGNAIPLWQQDIDLVEDVPQILVASSVEELTFIGYEDDFTPSEVGTTRFKAIHAIADGPEVEILAGGDSVTPNLAYGALIGTFDIPANIYPITVLPAGGSVEDAIIPETPFGLASNTTHTIIVYGTPDAPETLLLSAPINGNAGSGRARFAHTVAGAPAVDIYADGIMLIPGLNFGETSEHIALPAGTYASEVRVSGTDNTLVQADLEVTANTATTVAVLGTVEDLSVSIFPDPVDGISADMAFIRVFNSIPSESSVTVTLEDGTTLASDLASGESGDVIIIPATVQNVLMDITVSGQSGATDLGPQTFYGGVYYNALILPVTAITPTTVAFNPTSLAQAPGSAPGADTAALTNQAVQEPEPTEETPTEIVALPTEAAAEPTAAPTTAPVETNEPAEFTARVLVDPGANIQLRQLPDNDALSLGLAPSGSILEVLGREGAAVNIEGVFDPDFVDPVFDLGDDEDLDPTQTWIKFIYFTPDGGEISAWNLAQFLVIRDRTGEDVRLADLPTVPGNSPGETFGTAVTAPENQEDLVTVEVINLNEGVNLNIRRTADSDGQVLARVPNGTVLELLGIGQSSEWLFIGYTTVDGGTVTGWISNQFADIFLNGVRVTQAELEAEGLLLLADEDSDIGEVEANDVSPASSQSSSGTNTTQTTLETPSNVFIAQVLTDLGRNLNVRRTPNANSEVLVRIPGGSEIVIDGRTDTGNWLFTTFEGEEGWVSSDFVFLTFNDVPAEVEEVPIIAEDADSVLNTDANAENIDETEVEETVVTDCPVGGSDLYLPARISLGTATAQVIPDGEPNRIRAQPSTDAEVIGTAQPGRRFDQVLEGPVCQGGLTWWRVELDGVQGWTAESDGVSGTYFLQPPS